MRKGKDMTKSYDVSENVKRMAQKTKASQGKFPKADWVEQPASWNRQTYIEETKQEILEVYGEMSVHDQKLVSLLADQIDAYTKCSALLEEQGIIYAYNNGKTMGPSPAFKMRMQALDSAIKVMTELGLTLKSRIGNKAKPKSEPSNLDVLLRGPKG